MDTDERFEQIYSKIVEENKEELEKSRQEAKQEIIKIVSIIIIGIILFLIINKVVVVKEIFEKSSGILSLIIIFLIIIILCRIAKNSKILQYKNKFKMKVIKSLLNSFEENIMYFPKEGVKSQDYDEGGFEKYDLFNSEDLMKGVLKNECDFQMSEVETTDVQEDEEGKKNYITIFHGIFAKIKTPKPFNTTLYLKQDYRDKNFLNKMISSVSSLEKIRVNLDSQEFEKYFDVYSTDKIIAMQLLTADIMQLLINFKKEMKMYYEITIKNNSIYIRFRTGKMFEPVSVFGFSLDKKTIYKYYKILDFVFSLTDNLINLIKETEY